VTYDNYADGIKSLLQPDYEDLSLSQKIERVRNNVMSRYAPEVDAARHAARHSAAINKAAPPPLQPPPPTTDTLENPSHAPLSTPSHSHSHSHTFPYSPSLLCFLKIPSYGLNYHGFPSSLWNLAYSDLTEGWGHHNITPGTNPQHYTQLPSRTLLIHHLLFGSHRVAATRDEDGNIDRLDHAPDDPAPPEPGHLFELFDPRSGALAVDPSNEDCLINNLEWRDWPALVALLKYYLTDLGNKDYELSSCILILLSHTGALNDPLCLHSLLHLISTPAIYPYHNSHCVEENDTTSLDEIKRMQKEEDPIDHNCYAVDQFFCVLAIAIGAGYRTFSDDIHDTVRPKRAFLEIHGLVLTNHVKQTLEASTPKPSTKSGLTTSQRVKTSLLKRGTPTIARAHKLQTQLLESLFDGLSVIGGLSFLPDVPKAECFSDITSNYYWIRRRKETTSVSPDGVNPENETWLNVVKTVNTLAEDVVMRTNANRGVFKNEEEIVGCEFIHALVNLYGFYERREYYGIIDGKLAPKTRFGPFFIDRYTTTVKHATNRRQNSPLAKLSPSTRELVAKSIALAKVYYTRDKVGVEYALGYGDFLNYMDQSLSVYDGGIWKHDLNYAEGCVENCGVLFFEDEKLVENTPSDVEVMQKVLVQSFLDNKSREGIWDIELEVEHSLYTSWNYVPVEEMLQAQMQQEWDLNKVVAPMYEYSLMLLNRECSRQWCVENHWSFGSQYRDAVMELFFVGYRTYLMPEVTRQIVEFLPRWFWAEGEWDKGCARFHCGFEWNVQKLCGCTDENKFTPRLSPEKKKKTKKLEMCECGMRFCCKMPGKRTTGDRTDKPAHGKNNSVYSCVDNYLYEEHKRECGTGSCRFPMSEKERRFVDLWEKEEKVTATEEEIRLQRIIDTGTSFANLSTADVGDGGKPAAQEEEGNEEEEDDEDDWEDIDSEEEEEEDDDGDELFDNFIDDTPALDQANLTPYEKARAKSKAVRKHTSMNFERTANWPWAESSSDEEDDANDTADDESDVSDDGDDDDDDEGEEED
jgi:hypothetical protein